MDNFSVPSGSLPPIPPTVGNNNAPVAPPIVQQTPPSTPPSAPPTSTPTATFTASSAPSVPVAKILLAVIPFFAFIVTGAISYNLMNQKPSTQYLSRASEPTSAPITLLNPQIARKTIDWLNKQKDEKGLYYLAKSYPDNNSSQPIGDGRVGVYPLWAKFLYWQKTNDEEIGKSMEEDLNVFDNNKQRYFQPEFWSCKILYDLFLDTNLSPETKLKAKTLCERADFYVEIIKKDGYLWSDTIITPVPEKNPGKIDNSKIDLAKFSAYASDFSTRYLWDNNTNNLTIAKTLFNLSAASYESQKSKGFVPGECVLGIAAIDLYKSTKDESYKKFTTDLFDKRGQLNPITLFDKITCGIWSRDLDNLNHETKYQKRKEEIMQDLVNNHYDQTVGAFYTPYGSNRFFEIRENSLMVDLLLN